MPVAQPVPADCFRVRVPNIEDGASALDVLREQNTILREYAVQMHDCASLSSAPIQ